MYKRVVRLYQFQHILLEVLHSRLQSNQNIDASLAMVKRNNIQMKMIKTALFSTVLLTSTGLFIQSAFATETTPATHTAPAYGDNPNIFKVLRYKAQAAAHNTAEIVDQAAQKGVAKVQPKVATAWQESKEFASETSVIAKEKSQQAAATVNQKINQTKEGLVGSPNQSPAPIESRPLSQSSSDFRAPTPPQAPANQHPAAQPPTSIDL